MATCQAIRPVRFPYGSPCDVVGDSVAAAADSAGNLATTVAVQAGFYGYGGRVDCTAEPCVVLIQDGAGASRVFAAEPISFASTATFPEPRLAIDPPGPTLAIRS